LNRARHSPAFAAVVRDAIERYRAALHRGESPEMDDLVFVGLEIEGLSIGSHVVLTDEVKQPPGGGRRAGR